MLISIININNLFDKLWPEMHGCATHKSTCISNLKKINELFVMHNVNHNKLLNALVEVNGIGIPIASGLIWSVYPEKRVPFDKYTLSYALQKRILHSINIKNNYTQACEKVLQYCKKESFNIEGFVRVALENAHEIEFELQSPI